MRLYLLRKLISLNVYDYFKEVILKVISVSLLSVIIPLFIYFLLEPSLIRFVLVVGSCVISTGISIYFYGLKNTERKYIVNIIRERVAHVE